MPSKRQRHSLLSTGDVACLNVAESEGHRCVISEWILDNVVQVKQWPSRLTAMLTTANNRTSTFIQKAEEQLRGDITKLVSHLDELPTTVEAMEHEGATKRKERFRQRVIHHRHCPLHCYVCAVAEAVGICTEADGRSS